MSPIRLSISTGLRRYPHPSVLASDFHPAHYEAHLLLARVCACACARARARACARVPLYRRDRRDGTGWPSSRPALCRVIAGGGTLPPLCSTGGSLVGERGGAFTPPLPYCSTVNLQSSPDPTSTVMPKSPKEARPFLTMVSNHSAVPSGSPSHSPLQCSNVSPLAAAARTASQLVMVPNSNRVILEPFQRPAQRTKASSPVVVERNSVDIIAPFCRAPGPFGPGG